MSALGLKGLEPLLRGADMESAVVLAEMEESPEREGITWQFVREGLAKDEKVLVILAQTQLDDMKKGLSRLGLSLDDEIKNGKIVAIDWWEIAIPDLPHAASKLLDLIEEKLDSMDSGAVRRVLITGLQNIVASLLAPRQIEFVSALVSHIQSGANLGMAVLDPKDMPEQTIMRFHEPFDGVMRVAKDSLAEGYMIGVVSFFGVEKTGIYLPLLKDGDEYVAGLAAKGGPGSEACPLCGFQVLPGFDRCPRCKADLRKTKEVSPVEVDAVFDYLEKLKGEVKSDEPEKEEGGEGEARRKKLEDFLHSIGAFEEGGEEAAKEKLKEVMQSRTGAKQSRKKSPENTNGGSSERK